MIRTEAATLPTLKRQLTSYSKRVWERGWVANHDGNLSARLPGARALCTPTSFCKGDVTENDLLIVDKQGKKLEGRWKPFGELSLHLLAYKVREDVGAVLHAHPPTATGFACAGIDVETTIIAEAVVSLGARVPTIAYALPGSESQLESLAAALLENDAVVIANHGVITVGTDLEQAYLRMELVEHLAKIKHVALSVGGVRRIPDHDVTRLLAKRKDAGLGPAGRAKASA